MPCGTRDDARRSPVQPGVDYYLKVPYGTRDYAWRLSVLPGADDAPVAESAVDPRVHEGVHEVCDDVRAGEGHFRPVGAASDVSIEFVLVYYCLLNSYDFDFFCIDSVLLDCYFDSFCIDSVFFDCYWDSLCIDLLGTDVVLIDYYSIYFCIKYS